MTTPNADYCIIPLTMGQVALVDAADYEHLNRWKWYALWSKCIRGFYAARTVNHRTVYMHREVLSLGPKDAFTVDHKDPSLTLDNRRSNLRIATHSQQQYNQRISIANRSGFKGVYYHKKAKKWQATIRIDGIQTYLGLFSTAEQAHNAYCHYALAYREQFARFS